MSYQGTVNMSTGVPALADGTGDQGDVYRVSVAGTRNLGSGSIAWGVGDYAIYNGSTWEKSDSTDAVASVNGYTGTVTLAKSDVGLGSVDNTSDAGKPVSTATQTALDAKEPTISAGSAGQYWTGSKTWATLNAAAVSGAEATANKNAANGYTGLDGSSKVAIGNLPTGTTSSTVCIGDDSRLSDARTPTTHSHAVSDINASTTTALGVGSIELGNASDTTLSRSAAGKLAVEGVDVVLTGAALGTPSSGTLTNCTFPTLNQNTTGTASNVTGTVAVGNGGSGATTLTGVLKGNGTSAFTAATAGTDYVAPGGALGTPSSGTLTNATGLPVSGITASTSTALGVGSVELGHASDTTLTRSAAGVLAVEGVDVVTTSATQTLTNKTATNPTITNYTESVVAIGTVTSSNTIALTSGTVQTATLTASTACTFTMPTATAGKSFVLMLKQAASTGNGTATFTGVKWSGGTAPTITATAGKMDILSFFADGTNWYGSATQNFTP
jgi:hypothetical protein